MDEKEVLVDADASEAEIEKLVQATNPSSIRLTPADIDSCIVSGEYYQFQGTSHTVCCLMLKNGFTVIGESSHFDAAIGKKVAFKNARDKIWMLEGYLLRESMHRAFRRGPKLTPGQERFAEGNLFRFYALKDEPSEGYVDPYREPGDSAGSEPNVSRAHLGLGDDLDVIKAAHALKDEPGAY